MDFVKINQVYKHYSGKYCFVKDIVINSETQEQYVLYQDLDTSKNWIIPVRLFIGQVYNENKESLKRFDLINLNDKER